jgi:FkbM family methyltransferase
MILPYILGGIRRRIIRALRKSVSFMQELPGVFLQFKVNRSKKPIIFRDRFGFQFWQYPGDDVRYHRRHNAITDSVGVVNFILKHVKQGSTCVDIGAAQAAVSVSMWSKTGLSGRVISVEADVSKIPRIKANLKLNGFPQDLVAGVAISDGVGIRSLRCYPDSPGWNTFGNPEFARDYDSFVIDVQTIDFSRLLQSYEIDYVDLVKLDTEGAELLILQGMHRYLAEQRIGCVVFEVNPLTLPGLGTTVHQLLSFWDNLQYLLYQLSGDGHLTPLLNNSWPSGKAGDCVALAGRGAIRESLDDPH